MKAFTRNKNQKPTHGVKAKNIYKISGIKDGVLIVEDMDVLCPENKIKWNQLKNGINGTKVETISNQLQPVNNAFKRPRTEPIVKTISEETLVKQEQPSVTEPILTTIAEETLVKQEQSPSTEPILKAITEETLVKQEQPPKMAFTASIQICRQNLQEVLKNAQIAKMIGKVPVNIPSYAPRVLPPSSITHENQALKNDHLKKVVAKALGNIPPYAPRILPPSSIRCEGQVLKSAQQAKMVGKIPATLPAHAPSILPTSSIRCETFTPLPLTSSMPVQELAPITNKVKNRCLNLQETIKKTSTESKVLLMPVKQDAIKIATPSPRMSAQKKVGAARVKEDMNKIEIKKKTNIKKSPRGKAVASATLSNATTKSTMDTTYSEQQSSTTARNSTPSIELSEMHTLPDDERKKMFLSLFDLITFEMKAQILQKRPMRRRRNVQRVDFHYGPLENNRLPSRVTQKNKNKTSSLLNQVKRPLQAKSKKRRNVNTKVNVENKVTAKASAIVNLEVNTIPSCSNPSSLDKKI